MAIINCKECGSQYSDSRHGCPSCSGGPKRRFGRADVGFLLAIAIAAVVFGVVKINGPDRQADEHLAAIEDGAVPAKIGCDVGCDKLNRFERWQPYLAKVAELHRRQQKCKAIEYVTVDLESSPNNPSFVVMCRNEQGQSYNSFYSKQEVDASQVARSDDVSETVAFSKCDQELPRYFPGYFDGAVTKRGFYVAPNGSVRVTYDLVIAGHQRMANCLVDHKFVEFTVVK